MISRLLLALICFVLVLSTASGRSQDSVRDRKIDRQAAVLALDSAARLAREKKYLDATSELETVRPRANEKQGSTEDQNIDHAILLLLARCYFQDSRFQKAIGAYQQIVESGDPNWDSVEPELVETFVAWASAESTSNRIDENLGEMLKGVLPIWTREFGGQSAELLLFKIGQRAAVQARPAINDAVVDFFADQGYSTGEFATSFAPVLRVQMYDMNHGARNDKLGARDPDIARWGILQDVCRAYGFLQDCANPTTNALLSSVSTRKQAFNLFPSIGDSIASDRGAFAPALHVFVRQGPVTSARALEFSRLLTQIASEMSAIASFSKDYDSSEKTQQAATRFRAAYFFDTRNLEAAAQALQLLAIKVHGQPLSDGDKEFARSVNRSVDSLFSWKTNVLKLAASKERGQKGDFEAAVRTKLALLKLNMGKSPLENSKTLRAVSNAALQQDRPIPETLFLLGQTVQSQAVQSQDRRLASRLFLQADYDAKIVEDHERSLVSEKSPCELDKTSPKPTQKHWSPKLSVRRRKYSMLTNRKKAITS